MSKRDINLSPRIQVFGKSVGTIFFRKEVDTVNIKHVVMYA